MDIFYEKTLRLGQIIAMHRRALGWTQEQLGEYLGITKASISKWETGQTHPDILLLPDLATLFNITIDELLNYQSQLSKEQIIFLYQNLSKLMDTQGLASALNKIRYYLRKHGNCTDFLLGLIQWLLNAATLTKDEIQKTECFEQALHLTAEVHRISQDPLELNQAMTLEVSIHMMRGNFPLVIEMSHQVLAPERFALDELYLSALIQNGDLKQATEAGQVLLFMHLNSILSLINANLELVIHDKQRLETLIQLGKEIIQILDLNTIPSNPVLVFYLQVAACYCQIGAKEQALTILESYVATIEKLTFPLTMKGNEFFDKIQPWIKSSLVLAENAPVNDLTIKQNMLISVLKNPLFQPLQSEQGFQKIIKRLQQKLEVPKC